MKNIGIITCLLIFLLDFHICPSQTIISNETNQPDSSSILELNSHNLGWLIPRMTTQQRDSINNPAEGLMIYNLDTESIEFYNGSRWVNTNESAMKNLSCGTYYLTFGGLTYGTVFYNGRCWLDRNIGALKTGDSINDSLSYGSYFQWGRGPDGHQVPGCDTTWIVSSTPYPDHGYYIIAQSEPYDWLSPQNPDLWNEASNFTNNPCPPGWIVPSAADWATVLNLWNNVYDAFNSPLRITAGGRKASDGNITQAGTSGQYWTSLSTNARSFNIVLNQQSKSISPLGYRYTGMTIRCIQADEQIYTPTIKLMGGVQGDYGYSIYTCNDAGNIILGTSNSFNDTFNNDYLMIKLGNDGSIQWCKTYGNDRWEYGRSVIQTMEGGYILNGTRCEFSPNYNQMYIIKTDIDGAFSWSLLCGSTGIEEGYDIIQDVDTGYLCLGSTDSYGGGGYDVYFRKIDKTGDFIYSYAIGGENSEFGHAVIQDSVNGYAILGGYCCLDGYGSDLVFYRVIYDTALHIDYSWLLGGTENEEAGDLVLSHDSGYVIAGSTNSFGNGSYDIYIHKLDAEGNSEWAYSYGGIDTDKAKSIIMTADNGFAILGYTKSFVQNTMNDVWLLKIDADGLFEWSYVYGINGPEFGNSLTLGLDGKIFATGYAVNTPVGPGGQDILYVEFNPDGSTCLGQYIDPTGEQSPAGDEFHSTKIPEENVIIRKIEGDIRPVKLRVLELKDDITMRGERDLVNDTIPVVITICE